MQNTVSSGLPTIGIQNCSLGLKFACPFLACRSIRKRLSQALKPRCQLTPSHEKSSKTDRFYRKNLLTFSFFPVRNRDYWETLERLSTLAFPSLEGGESMGITFSGIIAERR
jgi:hypothetical protein